MEQITANQSFSDWHLPCMQIHNIYFPSWVEVLKYSNSIFVTHLCPAITEKIRLIDARNFYIAKLFGKISGDNENDACASGNIGLPRQ